jgi:hypothetical protein
MKGTRRLSAGNHRRSGVAILWVLFVLVLLSAVIGLITKQHMAGRSFQDQRAKRLQAEWLARAGSEVALAKLLQSPQAFSGDIGDLLPDSKVHVEIKSASGSTTDFEVTSEAHFPISDAHPVIRSLSRQVRRAAEKGQVRLTPIEADKNNRKE